MHQREELMRRLGVTFSQPGLLERALTHRSYLNETPDVTQDNERLEFLGDAVLDFVVGAYLFRHFPNMHEGEMTALRAALVRSETLASFAQELTIDDHLLLGHGEQESGGRQKTATLCAAFEAVIGAIYLDQGLSIVAPLIEALCEPTLAKIQAEALHKDAKSEFQVWSQGTHGITPHYRVVAESGPDHAKQFTVQVLLEDAVWGEGSGHSKRQAAQVAAAHALAVAEQPGWTENADV
jgi:ribonuclease-3